MPTLQAPDHHDPGLSIDARLAGSKIVKKLPIVIKKA
jgi:hypothetical protein